DDICDTAGTLSKAAALIMENGANSVRAVCTHAVLSGKAYETIENSVLAEMIVTDTIQLHPEKSKFCSKIKVLSTADLFASAIKNVNAHGSISDLFDIKSLPVLAKKRVAFKGYPFLYKRLRFCMKSFT